MRNLATIEKIIKLSPIEGADAIELATIKGWQVVVKKGEFKVDHACIYVEIDSILPDRPEFEFMRSRNFRVKTIRLKGQVSQGICFPVSILPHDSNFYCLNDNVTEVLGITKYLSPSEQEEIRKELIESSKLKKFMLRYSIFRKLFLSRKQKEGFPYWISKTDEPRINSFPQLLTEFADKKVYITEKIDYQSVSFTGKMIPKFSGLLGKLIPVKKFKFVVCSRNLTNEDKSSLYWQIAKKYNIEAILKENPTLTIQGEQGDTKVQGNKYGIKEPKFWVFNIIDHEKNYHYNAEEMVEFCGKYGLLSVPMLAIDTLNNIGKTVNDFIEYSKGKSTLANIPREGVVVRCIENGKKILSFKAINPDFLLKYNE